MNAFDRKKIRDVAAELNVAPALVEKEWHAVKSVGIVHAINDPTFIQIFSGGTSLSTAHRATQRFSEDIDFKLRLRPKVDDRKSLQAAEALCRAICDAMTAEGYTEDAAASDQNPQFLYFKRAFGYRSEFEKSATMREHIQIELSRDDSSCDPIELDVASACTRLAAAAPDHTGIRCVPIVETGSDKLCALTWRVLNHRADKDADRLMRHLYDLGVVTPKFIGTAGVRQILIGKLRQEAASDRAKAYIDRAFPCDAVQRKRDNLARNGTHRASYEAFIHEMTYHQDPPAPSFDASLGQLDNLIGVIRS
jgi:hypothetical protein